MAREDPPEALVERSGHSATSSARHRVTAGVNGLFGGVLPLARGGAAPVEVVAAARPLGGGASARSDTEAKPSPGGHISDFCEPETTTSTPHSSWGRSTAPSPETASTQSIDAVLRRDLVQRPGCR